jgi:DNA-binding NarL/FixJ family response regulator
VKDAPAEELLVAVRGVLRGDAMVSPSVTRRLLDRYLAHDHTTIGAAKVKTLTGREKDVLGLVARGLSNNEIAGRLVIGETTVKTQVGRVLAKLGLRDRVHAVVFAHESGLVRPGG